MVFARVVDFFSGSPAASLTQFSSSNSSNLQTSAPIPPLLQHNQSSHNTQHDPSNTTSHSHPPPERLGYLDIEDTEEEELEEPRPEYHHAMLAGGLGGLCGDMLMHSLDTVKTRQQGDPHRPPKYRHLTPSYIKILSQEGIRRGLYGGAIPAAIGSFAGTSIFFGTYEFTKRYMIDNGIAPSIAYLTAGLMADLVASPVYVPTEVIKTRLQLQGRHDNPFFHSGYNYHSSRDALRTILRTEGFAALFHGYRATLYRDLPFSALQFAFYEKERDWAKGWMGSKDIGLTLEIITGMTAGGLAGTITCPLDVVKTRIQTQLPADGSNSHSTHDTTTTISKTQPQRTHPPSAPSFTPRPSTTNPTPLTSQQPRRNISTSSPSTTLPHDSSHSLPTSSVVRGLHFIYQTEGMAGLFRGVGPRAVWTSVQSGTMLVLYQALLRWFEEGRFGLL